MCLLCILAGAALPSCAASPDSDAASETPAAAGSASEQDTGDPNAQPGDNSGSAPDGSSSASQPIAQDGTGESDSGEQPNTPNTNAAEEAVYPRAWLAVDYEGLAAGSPVDVLLLPDFSIVPRAGGQQLPEQAAQELAQALPEHSDANALVRQGETLAEVPPDYLLVNLPDLIANAEFDIVYSYAATSNCGGTPLPGITGTQVDGYPNGMQENAYLGKESFSAPCAYRTAVKASRAAAELDARGYRLLVFDAYRPMRAQYALADSIANMYASDPSVQQILGEWSTNWYVANGPSGHNFGTDLDVGVCDTQGIPIPMPSPYDTFGGAGHLTAYPVDAASITPELYTDLVSENAACMALHEAFVAAGFSELASEWWHFGDAETESIMRSLVGDSGLDHALG